MIVELRNWNDEMWFDFMYTLNLFWTKNKLIDTHTFRVWSWLLYYETKLMKFDLILYHLYYSAVLNLKYVNWNTHI